MNFNIEVRKRQLQSLDQYINSSRNRLLSLLGQLGWSAKRVLETNDHIGCPINAGHKIPLQNIDKHVQKCCLKSSGYDLSAEFLSEPNPSQSSIVLDSGKKIDILNAARTGKTTFKTAWNGVEPDPLTCDRLFTTFSTDERTALYDYCVANTEPPPTPSEFLVNLEEKTEDPKDLTPEEILQQERNAKRRRVKYKSVHTGRNKSYTEVMREVIKNQMELYQDLIAKTTVKEEKNEEYVQYSGQQHEIYQGIPFIDESIDHNDKTVSDIVSSTDSYHGHQNEKDEHGDIIAKDSRLHKEHSRRHDDDRSRHRYKRRSRDRERRHSRSRPKNGYDRYHESHRRDKRY